MESVKKISLVISLALNIILGLALFFAVSAGLVQYGQKKQYEKAFDSEMAKSKKECKKLNPCKPCKKCPTKEELLKEITEGDILRASIPKEQFKVLFPENENFANPRE